MVDIERDLDHIRNCYEAVAKGGTKVAYENTFISITAYRVGEIIRIDIKDKETKQTN